MQGITGKVSGKMGSAVFRVRNGAQVVTQYNPIVKNPNSEGQQAARAKFKLLSQLGSIMESGFGTLGVTKRAGKSAPTQRNAFMKLNYGIVSTSDSGDTGVRASIPMEKLKLTSSARPLGTMTQANGVVSISNIPEDVASVRFVEVGYRQITVIDPETGAETTTTRAEINQIEDVPVSGNAVSYEAGDLNTTVLAYGLIPSASAGTKVNLDNVHTPADEDFISAVDLDAMVREGLMAETLTLGVNVEGLG